MVFMFTNLIKGIERLSMIQNTKILSTYDLDAYVLIGDTGNIPVVNSP